jgi:hypothetical protein
VRIALLALLFTAPPTVGAPEAEVAPAPTSEETPRTAAPLAAEQPNTPAEPAPTTAVDPGVSSPAVVRPAGADVARPTEPTEAPAAASVEPDAARPTEPMAAPDAAPAVPDATPEGPEIEPTTAVAAPARPPKPKYNGRPLMGLGIATTGIGTLLTLMGTGFAIASATQGSKGQTALRKVFAGIGLGLGLPSLGVGIPSLTIGLRRVRAHKAWVESR